MKSCAYFRLTVGLLLLTSGSVVMGAPKVVCLSPVYDFGMRQGAQAVEHAFVLENQGDEPLIFGRVRTCCGATATLRDKTVAPGSNTVLQVKLSLRGRRGKVKKSIYVSSNAPKQPYLRLQLSGQIATVGRFRIDPERIDFGVVPMTSSDSRTIKVKTANGQSVTNCASPTETFAVALSTTSSNRQTVSVSLEPPLPLGTTKGDVLLLTDSEETPRIKIPVRVHVGGDIVAVPNVLTVVASDDDATPVTRYLALRSRQKKPFAVTGIDVPEASMQATPTELRNGIWRIKIEGIPPLSRLDGAAITLKTDRRNQSVISLPIRVIKQ